MARARVDEDEAVALLASEPRSTGIFTDFDGTLSPIVPDPASAGPLPEALEALRSVVARLALVAVVSGRPAAWLATRLAAEPGLQRLELFGLHGLERWDGASARPVDAALPWMDVVARAAAEARDAAVPGLEVEDKVFGLTLHWRRATDPDAVQVAGSELAERLVVETGMRARPGKASVELVPPIGIDKGTVVRERGKGLARVAYLGDDVGDACAFDGLDDLEREGALVLRVAISSPEVPEELVERADLVLAGPTECVAMLARVGEAAAEAPAEAAAEAPAEAPTDEAR
jgi:trehalose 6-phosphate phosphatase